MHSEILLRLGTFAVAFVVMAGWELVTPWRARIRRRRRWRTNLLLAALDAALVRLALPMGAIGVAFVAGDRGWGILPRLPLPGWATLACAVVALDLAIYVQHVAFHAVPWLWRLHRVHHADEHLDVSTGVRFHPAEALLSLAWKALVIVALGASPEAVFLFELILNTSSLFNHGNVNLPRRVERWVRWLVVTPAMHRIHHSRLRIDADSNFGFNFTWWDRVFGTHRDEAVAGEELRFGVADLAGEPSSLRWVLRLPFVGEPPKHARASSSSAKLVPPDAALAVTEASLDDTTIQGAGRFRRDQRTAVPLRADHRPRRIS